jgi:hypothetical protein
MKSYVRELSRVWENLVRDARQAYPDLENEFERDLDRLHALVETRGLRVFLEDLPAAAKHLDRCLSAGQYVSNGVPATRRVSRSVAIPRFLRGLYLLIFSERGCLRDDCDVTAVAFLRQLLLVGKKATVACSDTDTEKEILSFCAVDRELPEPPRSWQEDDPWAVTGPHWFSSDDLYVGLRKEHLDGNISVHDLTTCLDKVVGHVCSALGSYDFRDWSFRHGPGAVAERTGCVNKYVFTNWSERLERVYPYADVAFHSHSSWAETAVKDLVTSYEAPSRLIAVPKSVDKPRLIAAEPTEHQWCQQNIWHYFCVRSRRSWIGNFLSFDSQELNQNLCLRASADGSLSTLDLSSASDRVTCQTVQSMFWRIPTLLASLHATRTRWVKIPLNGGYHLSLRKYATMGSACTFPVESLVFLSVALAATLLRRGLRVTRENILSLTGEVAVFGDDIITPSDSRELCVDALELLRFKINERKSFSEGNFRESCGVDAFQGQQVTPAYWNGPNTSKPEAVASTVAVHNNFLEKGLLYSARYIASTVRKEEAPFVSANSGVYGLKSHVMPDPKTLYRCRWNLALQRDEVLVPRLLSGVRKTAIVDDSALLQYFTEKPDPQSPWESGVAQRPTLRLRRGWVAVSDILAQRMR